MSKTAIDRVGFGQVEPNHLSAQGNRQIYAQLPANDSIEILENGQFVKYDYATGEVNFTGKGEWMMVWNEVKLYDDRWRESYKDYAMIKTDFTPGSKDITHDGLGPFVGQMTPRVIKTFPGDIYTTNSVGKGNKGGKVKLESGVSVEKGDVLKVDPATGFLVEDAGSKENPAESKEPMLWQVAKVYTLADGQPAVKLQRIK